VKPWQRSSGEKASGLSATNIVRLKMGWEADYKAWSQRDSGSEALRLLVGRLLQRPMKSESVLVLIGATEDGT
jgi:hypothetical protein